MMQPTYVPNFKKSVNAKHGEIKRKVIYNKITCLMIGNYSCRTLPEDKKIAPQFPMPFSFQETQRGP